MSAQPKSAITPAASAIAAPVGPIATALQSAGVLDAVTQGKAHLVSPIVAIDSLSEMTRMSVRMVRVDRARETYPITGGKLGLLKVALDKIAGAAQVDWVYSGQVDDWNDPHHVKYHAIGVVTNPDGTKRRLPGTKVLDLRKVEGHIGEDAAGMSDRELAMARKHIHALAESKAKNRAIRSLGIPQAMTPADAELPWVVVTLVPNSDHPAIREAMVASLVPTQALLYGHRVQPPALPNPSEIEAGEERPDALDVSDMVEAAEPPAAIAGTPADPAIAGQRDLPLEPPVAATEADPWDTPALCPLPVSEELLARVPVADERRMKYLCAVNRIYADLVARRGAQEAQAIAAKVVAGFDPFGASLDDVARVGAALRAELGGAK